jgi:hypothetical protein
MGTDRFREDVSEALKKFVRAQPGRTPQVLRVNLSDAMAWQAAEHSNMPADDFIAREVASYVATIPWQKSTLRCRIKVLDDESPTRFE